MRLRIYEDCSQMMFTRRLQATSIRLVAHDDVDMGF